jgi:molecular chaperone IbpA
VPQRSYDYGLFRSIVGSPVLAETAGRAAEETYPYNIKRLPKTGTRYHWRLRFSPEVAITAEPNVITIEGSKAEMAEREFLYRGISTRTSNGNSANYVQVKGVQPWTLLKIELARDPDAMYPRRIAVNADDCRCPSV